MQTRAAGDASFTPKAAKPMKIVFVSTEVAPWSKTGGLGDVVGSLPIELAKRGHKVMTISPRYDQYKGAWDTSIKVDALGKQVSFFHEHKKGVDRVFVDHPLFLAKVWGKTGSKLYGKTNGADFADNQERFAMFCKAALEAPLVLPFGFGEDVCFVSNDWHSGLVPVMLNKVYRPNGECPRLLIYPCFASPPRGLPFLFPSPLCLSATVFFFRDGCFRDRRLNSPREHRGKRYFHFYLL